jgi:hypothetical protein
MRNIEVQITGLTPMLQSRFHNEPKLNRETPDAYEKRTWQLKAHSDRDGLCFVPAFSLKKTVQEVAKYLSIQIPGKGKSTYTKHFKAGVLTQRHATLLSSKGQPLEAKFFLEESNPSCFGQEIFVNADGVSGSGKRVMRTFPTYAEGWMLKTNFMITDDTITAEVFETHLVQAGQLIGIGAFRIGNGGVNGMFGVKVLSAKSVDFAA